LLGEDVGESIFFDALKGLTSAQTYTLPEDIESYKSVIIWFGAFEVLLVRLIHTYPVIGRKIQNIVLY